MRVRQPPRRFLQGGRYRSPPDAPQSQAGSEMQESREPARMDAAWASCVVLVGHSPRQAQGAPKVSHRRDAWAPSSTATYTATSAWDTPWTPPCP